jgi:hypothetical protein
MRQTRRMGQNPMSGMQSEIRNVVRDCGAGSIGRLVSGLGGGSVGFDMTADQ